MPRTKHSVYDTDTHFIINPTSRQMTNAAFAKTCLIRGDHNSERYTFEIPRMIEGHDMSLCDAISVHYVNTDKQTKAQSKGVYIVDDMQTSPASDDVIIFSWLIPQTATRYVGSLEFLIHFVCHDNNTGRILYIWNTAIHTGISISEGIYNTNIYGEQPQLNAPSISINADTDTLTITDGNNGNFTSGYKLFMNGILIATVTNRTVSLLDYAEYMEGTEITVKAIGNLFKDSEMSNAAVWRKEVS